MFTLIDTASESTSNHVGSYSEGSGDVNARTIAYEFLPEFEPPIESGRKTQTFRRRRDGLPPAAGDRIHGFIRTGFNTSRLILDAPIIEVLDLHIDLNDHWPIWLDGHPLTSRERDSFVRADGFQTFKQFKKFMIERYGNKPFSGLLIKWGSNE